MATTIPKRSMWRHSPINSPFFVIIEEYFTVQFRFVRYRAFLLFSFKGKLLRVFEQPAHSGYIGSFGIAFNRGNGITENGMTLEKRAHHKAVVGKTWLSTDFAKSYKRYSMDLSVVENKFVGDSVDMDETAGPQGEMLCKFNNTKWLKTPPQ